MEVSTAEQPQRIDCPNCGSGYRHALDCKFSASAVAYRCRDCGGALHDAHSENCGIGRGEVDCAHVGDVPVR